VVHALKKMIAVYVKVTALPAMTALVRQMVMLKQIVLVPVMVMLSQIVLDLAYLVLYLAGKVMATVMMAHGVLIL
jgi:hypothetical protein